MIVLAKTSLMLPVRLVQMLIESRIDYFFGFDHLQTGHFILVFLVTIIETENQATLLTFQAIHANLFQR